MISAIQKIKCINTHNKDKDYNDWKIAAVIFTFKDNLFRVQQWDNSHESVP